jgi:hypothetical protein
MNEVNAESQKTRGNTHTHQDSLPGAFEQAVDVHCQRTAIGSGGWRPTYRELNAARRATASPS